MSAAETTKITTPLADPPAADSSAANSPAAGGGLLTDLIVLDLSRALAGPHAGMLLGDLGARVIKIESPGGDDTRGWGPPFVSPEESGGAAGAESTYFLSCNRNKESVVLDLKSDAGRATLSRLVRRADVLIENFRTGVLDRLGFSVTVLHELNPGLIVLSITGFGHDGPDGGRAGYDQIAQGEAGLMSVTGPAAGPSTKVGVPIADLLAGIHGAYGVLAALHERVRTGRGRVVRSSLLSSVVGVHAFQGTRWTVAGQIPTASGDHHPSICPYGLFHSADGEVQIAVGSEVIWRSFAPAFALDRPGWETNPQRVADYAAVIAAVEAAFAEHTSAALLRRLDALGVPAGRVRTIDEVYAWAQTRSQGLLLDVDHRTLGRIQLPGNALRFDDNPVSGGRAHHLAPPTLGQHTDDVLAWLDAAEAEAARPGTSPT